MSGLVYGNGAFLLGRGDFGAFFQSADDAVDGIHKILFLYPLFVFAGSDEGGLVAHVGDVGTREAGRLAGQQVGIDGVVDFHAAQVYFEYLFPVVEVGQFDIDLAVETSGTEQGLVENVGTVGGGQYDDTAVGTETVHLGEELVEGIFPLVV